ncbi:MAG TPA: type II toxin-antitoxin system PemK/MazF family toxin [Longimicrobiaceae bacterium]|nr:type II toxin-antitoxin system PemK/MazF family toxin [Longimicrobiaceae bacterium]
MAYAGPVRRWDVFWADLEPHVGSEQAGSRRPVLVVSNDEFNKRFPVFTIVPPTKLEGKQRKPYPSEVVLPISVVGNQFTPVAQAFHIRTISPRRLLSYAGHLREASARAEVESALLAHLGIELSA